MSEFFADIKTQTFLQFALATGLLASVACGVIGSFVVARRITYIAGGIAHTVLAGLGAARYCQVTYGWQWFHPLYGAVIAALLAAAVIGTVSLAAHQREDTIIGAVWAVGMAVGILFIFKTPGYNVDLMSYLFGNILIVSRDDLWLIALLDGFIVAVTILFYNRFLAVCFDEEFARIRGVPVERYYLLLLAMTALTVVLLVTVVGIVMVIALLTLPAAVAGHFVKRLSHMMILATVCTALFTLSGIVVSYGPNLPSGATTIVIAGVAYLAVMLFEWLRTFGRSS
ncbi:MAG: metal ABC transporter permease [Deltaproteobacteria bacterium]|nr:metal ABC transporter permease [Deltaproteobacteria bacterium]